MSERFSSPVHGAEEHRHTASSSHTCAEICAVPVEMHLWAGPDHINSDISQKGYRQAIPSLLAVNVDTVVRDSRLFSVNAPGKYHNIIAYNLIYRITFLPFRSTLFIHPLVTGASSWKPPAAAFSPDDMKLNNRHTGATNTRLFNRLLGHSCVLNRCLL